MSDAPEVRIAVAEANLAGHEKVCAERYGNIEKSFERVHGRLDWIMYGMIALLLTIVGYLLVNGVPWPKVG